MSVLSLQKSSLLILSGHKPQCHTPIQVNTSNSSPRQARTECSSPRLTHEPLLWGTLPNWRCAPGSRCSNKDLAKMLAVHWYTNDVVSFNRSTRSTVNEIPGHKGHLKFQTEWWFKRHAGCVSLDTDKTNKMILVVKGNAPYPYPPIHTDLFSGLGFAHFTSIQIWASHSDKFISMAVSWFGLRKGELHIHVLLEHPSSVALHGSEMRKQSSAISITSTSPRAKCVHMVFSPYKD